MEFEVNNLAQLDLVAAGLEKMTQHANVFAFYGVMGAGKTTLIKAFCHHLGVTDEVNSPTFSLVNEYIDRNLNPLFHFDFYRINKLEEAYDIGYENYFFSNYLCLVEWPEKIEQLLPEKFVQVVITVDEATKTRTIHCQPMG